jgi:hypothetical protein
LYKYDISTVWFVHAPNFNILILLYLEAVTVVSSFTYIVVCNGRSKGDPQMGQNNRGRWSQYQILLANEKIKPYLVKTELFDEHSFFRNLHRHLSIRSCYGPTEIIVSVKDGRKEQYNVQIDQMTTTISGKAEVYQYIRQTGKTDQFCILQDTDFLYAKKDQIVELFVTVQRDIHLNWKTTDILFKNELTILNILGFPLNKLKKMAIETALSLVENDPKCSTVIVDFGYLSDQIWIRGIDLQFSKSKWSQHQILSSIHTLSDYLPHTQLATPQTFFSFLKKHKKVMLKPCMGQQGIGVVMVSLLKNDVFKVHTERTKVTIEGRRKLMKYIHELCFSRELYIFQERLPLATIDDHLFDIRVMANKGLTDSNWTITGKLAKVANKNYIVTNVAKALLPINQALQNSSIKMSPDKIINKMDEVCLIAATLLGENFPDINRIGFDIGIDQKGKIWIIEANLKPDILLFKRLADKTMYENMKNTRKPK